MARVLTTPSTAISSAIASSPYMMFSIMLTAPPSSSRMSFWSMTATAGFLPRALISAFSFASLGPPSIFTKIREMYGCASCGVTTFVSTSTEESTAPSS